MSAPRRSQSAAKEVPLTPQIEALIASLQEGSPSLMEDYKSIGNACFNNRSYLSAIKYYTKAIGSPGGSNNTSLYSNRSAAYLKSSMFSGPSLALKDAEKVVSTDPNWPKGHMRVGDAQYARKKYKEAVDAYQKALVLQPENTTLQDSLRLAKRELFLQELDKEENDAQHAAHLDGEALNKTSLGKEPSVGTSRTYGPGSGNPLPTNEQEEGEKVKENSIEYRQALIREWSKDTVVREGCTAMKPQPCTLDQANRHLGKECKTAWMNNFRTKLKVDESFNMTFQGKLEKEKLKGELENYREVDNLRNQLSDGTNRIGHAISADAYRNHTRTDRIW